MVVGVTTELVPSIGPPTFPTVAPTVTTLNWLHKEKFR